MGSLLHDKIELFSDRLIIETIRQWMVLILFTAILLVLLVSMVTLSRSYRRFFATDVIILALLCFKILLLLVNDFAVPHRFIVFCSELVHLTILTIIFYKFTKNLLKDKSGIFSYYKLYVGLIGMTIAGALVLGIVQFNKMFT